MKHYYRLGDAVVQMLLPIAIICAFAQHNEAIWPIATVASIWYIISIVVHLIIASYSYKQIYKAYAFLSVFVIAFIGAAYFSTIMLAVVICCMLYIVPAMGICFTCTCIAEILHVRKRPISYIK